MKLAKLEIDNWQTSLNTKEDARNTLNSPTRPKPLPPVIQTPEPMPSKTQTEQSPIPNKLKYSGTGFMFSSKDYVITNWHVIRGAKNIKVKFLNGETINAEVLLKDVKSDIAFLKLERSPQLPASSLRVGNSSNVRMGDKVFTIGYPAHWVMGQNPKYTEGVVNALSGIKDDPTVFQISAQIQPGNSGGPLFDQSGNVIGIAQASLDPQLATESIGTIPQNVNYAIKSSYIKKLLPMLPETLVSNRGIVVVPSEPKNSLANFIDKAKNNIALIEVSTK
jgi:S1-C subfamily serine protease